MTSISMAELTYRGLKYTQTKSEKESQEVHLQYCGHESMSKRIHEAMKAEMGWKAVTKNLSAEGDSNFNYIFVFFFIFKVNIKNYSII